MPTAFHATFGFVMLMAVLAFIVFALWSINKMFPNFADRMNATIDRLMGVDAEYDEKYSTGYTTRSRRNW